MADNALTNDDHNDRLRKEIYDLALNPDRDQTTIHNNGQATFSNRGYFGLAHGHAGEDTHEEEQRDQDKKSKIFRDNMQAMCSIAEINDSFTYDEPEWQTWDDLVRAQPNTFGDDGFSCTYTPEEEQTPQNDGTYGAVNLSSSEQVILNSATSINGLNEIIADVTSDPLIKTDVKAAESFNANATSDPSLAAAPSTENSAEPSADASQSVMLSGNNAKPISPFANSPLNI